MEHGDILLDIQGVKKHFPIGNNLMASNRKTLKAVDGVDLQIHVGEIYGLVGESGCGKSTLGRTVLRLHSVTEGSVVFNGVHIEGYSLKQMRPLRKEMQMIFQDPYASLNPRMNICASVKAPLDIQGGMSEGEKMEQVRDILNEVGMSEQQLYKYPHELSGGQRQRVVIARAMVTDPKFVVCDEPVSALDVSVRSQVLNLMKQMQRKTGVSYLFISHDLSVVKYLCETIAVMYLGKIVERASKKDLFDRPLHPYTRALMSAIPIPDIHVRNERVFLQGEIPNPVDPPSGCHFHTRCPYATEECRTVSPELKKVDGAHWVACHRVGEV